MFKPRRASRPHSDPSPARFEQTDIPLRKRCCLTVRDVALFLRDPKIRACLSEGETKIYLRWASGNIKRPVFARSMGMGEEALDIYLASLEKQVIQQALFCGVRLAQRVKPECPLSEDYWDFMQDQDRQTAEEHDFRGVGTRED